MKRLLFVWLILLIGCVQEEKSPNVYFDMKQKSEEVATDLYLSGAALSKEVVFNQDTESTTYTPDSLGWVKELEYFWVANINKNIYNDQYREETSQDDNSNLNILTYSHVSPEEAEIPVLRIYYLDSPENSRKIEIEVKENSTGYSLQRRLEMEFEEIHDELKLRSYSIIGGQKNIGQDSLLYTIRGTINY